MVWKRVVIAVLLLASIAGASVIVWLLREQGVTGLYPLGVGCLMVGLLGVLLQYGTSSGFKERHLSGAGWELFRDNLRRT